MSRINQTYLRRWITVATTQHPKDLSGALMARFCVSRAAAATALRKLEAEGWIIRHGTTRPTFELGPLRRVSKSYELPGIDEHLIWDHDFRPYFTLSDNVENICHHGFTEMVNNANDHSGGKSVTVIMRQDQEEIGITVADDGIGIFERISSSLGLPDRRLAILELSKGKLTTDPERHTGEGIFFTSRMFDLFAIDANDLHYTHDTALAHDWLIEDEDHWAGTTVRMAISASSTRTPKEIFDAYTSGPEDFSFNKTVVPVRLARLGNENLVSRSQAKRLIQRFESFRTVVLDFAEVPNIGQAFADELFRVFANAHPEVHLVPIGMAEEVAQMVKRTLT